MEVNCVEKYVTLVLEDGVPGVPPGIIGVEGVPVTQKLQSSVNHRFVRKQKFQVTFYNYNYKLNKTFSCTIPHK